MLFLISLLCAP